MIVGTVAVVVVVADVVVVVVVLLSASIFNVFCFELMFVLTL